MGSEAASGLFDDPIVIWGPWPAMLAKNAPIFSGVGVSAKTAGRAAVLPSDTSSSQYWGSRSTWGVDRMSGFQRNENHDMGDQTDEAGVTRAVEIVRVRVGA